MYMVMTGLRKSRPAVKLASKISSTLACSERLQKGSSPEKVREVSVDQRLTNRKGRLTA